MICQTVAGGCGHQFCWICLGVWDNHKECKPSNEENMNIMRTESNNFEY